MSNIDKELRLLHGDLSVLNAKKNDLKNKLKEAEELEENHNAYLHYLSAIGRDGIPYEIISKTIPNIQTEINNLLSQIVDFVVTLEVDGKNINAKLTYDFDRIWPLENSSGMERFVTSLAIRVALMNASNLPKPNFLMIDEGFGALDTEHLQSMQTLFNLLKTQFDFILIVSHLDTARDMVDNLIEIRKEDGYSQISV
jgi:DNA repair exonuclease SbcCD ATPase subunit